MTGYHTESKGIFDHTEDNRDRVKPIDKLSRPCMVMHDGSRVGLGEGLTYFGNELKYPPWEPQFLNKNAFTLGSFTNAIHNFDEPLGVPIEYYFACLGALHLYNSPGSSNALDATTSAQYTSVQNKSVTSLSCVTHEGSFSIAHNALAETMAETVQRMTSNITINAKPWELEAAPLSIGLTGSPGDWEPRFTITTEYWANFSWIVNNEDTYRTLNDSSSSYSPVYVYNGTTWFDEDTIKLTGRYVAEEYET